MSANRVPEDKLLDAWLRREREECTEDISIAYGVSTRSICKWIKRVNDSPKLLAKAKGMLTGNKSTKKNGARLRANCAAASVRAWLFQHPSGNRRAYMEDTGKKVSWSVFLYAKRSLKKVKKQRDKETSILTQVLGDTSTSLKDENTFLRWWVEGERKGFVDRLLSELKA